VSGHGPKRQDEVMPKRSSKDIDSAAFARNVVEQAIGVGLIANAA